MFHDTAGAALPIPAQLRSDQPRDRSRARCFPTARRSDTRRGTWSRFRAL